jgi:energy-coupling factor transport system substrate-specific component
MNRWTQREIVVVAAIGVVFGVVYLAWVQLWLLAQGAIGPLSLDIFFGLWCVASVLAAYVVRKPGAAFFSEVVAAVAEIATGNPAGLILLVTGVVQGAGAELPFAATRWRRYDWAVLLASGASAAVFSFVYTWIRFSYGALSPGLLVTMFVIRVISGMLLAGVLGKVLGDALLKTGAVDGLRIDQDRRAAHA